MNCTAFRSAIESAIENRQPLRSGIAAHLGDCTDAACRRAWNDAVLLDRAIDAWRATHPSVDVVDAVLSGCEMNLHDAVRSAHAPAAASRPAAARAAIAVAAAALALLVLLLLPSGADRPVAVQSLPAPEPRDPARDASLTYVTYAQNAAQIVTDAVVLTLGGSEQMERSTVTTPGLGWETGWPPLGEVHAALDDLLESLPDDPPQS